MHGQTTLKFPRKLFDKLQENPLYTVLIPLGENFEFAGWIKITANRFFWTDMLVMNKIMYHLKFTLEQATKAQRWSRGIALPFLEPRR